jgi:predicted transcriptional regulator
MNKIQLNSGFVFSVEKYNGKLRFAVHNEEEKSVCRIERKKSIDTFLQTKRARIFKGRLQLCKHNNEILIEAKGEVVGIIQRDDFAKMIDQHQ